MLWIIPLSVIGFILLYVITGLLLPYITVNSNHGQCETNPVTIYLKSNGVHTDIVMPLQNEGFDWTALTNPLLTRKPCLQANYVGIGWGDKGFYLDTPEWKDLTFKTAFKAMFYLSTTAMHVTFYDRVEEDARCVKINISQEEYQKITAYIKESFQFNCKQTILIPGASYASNDLFYEANGTYGLLKTCNTWVNTGLKVAGMKACLWTALDSGLLRLYRKY